jgi:hypothetical protein
MTDDLISRTCPRCRKPIPRRTGKRIGKRGYLYCDGCVSETRRASNKKSADKVRGVLELARASDTPVRCIVCDTAKVAAAFVRGQTSLVCKECRWVRRHTQRNLSSRFVGIVRNCLYRANARGIDFDIDGATLLELWKSQRGKCAYSRLPMTMWSTDYHAKGTGYRDPYVVSVDRIDNRKGYVPGNVVLCCLCVNLFKNRFELSVMKRVAKAIARVR